MPSTQEIETVIGNSKINIGRLTYGQDGLGNDFSIWSHFCEGIVFKPKCSGIK